MNDLDVRLGLDICSQRILVYIVKNGKLVDEIQGTVDLNESRYQKPSITLSYAVAQKVMDQLWNCGLRPTEGAGSAGAMAATQRHLNDMRALVEKHYGISLPCDNGR